MNAVLAIVHIVPGDKIIKEKTEKEKVESKPEVKEEVKEEPAADGEVKMEDTQAEGAEAEGGEDGVDDDEDEVPYIEEVGTREVAGFIVMLVPFLPIENDRADG
jgi:polyribonucleotide 5'-hydroxyl-kinase